MTDTEPTPEPTDDDAGGVIVPEDPTPTTTPSPELRLKAAELILCNTPLIANAAQVDGGLAAIDRLARYLSDGTITP